MKVIGYIRVSTDEQASHGVSLGAQRSKLEAFCSLYDYELVDVVVDAGASAKSLKRAGLQSVLASLDAGEAQGLVITKLDRLTRSVKDLGELLETHFSSKFDLLSVEDRFDTSTAAGRLALNMMASISQWEREVIGERTSAALQHKKAQGQHVGCAGLGYQMIEGALREDAEEQEVLERITEMKGEGLTLRAMAERLTEEGHKPKRGDRWHVSSLSRYCKKLGA